MSCRPTSITILSLVIATGVMLSAPALAEGTLYFAELGTGVRAVSTDGTGLTTIASGGWGIRGLAADTTHDRLYWSDIDADTIYRVNMDGTGSQPVLSNSLTTWTQGLYADGANDRLYWSNSQSPLIGVSDLDGNGATTWTTGLAMEDCVLVDSGKVYWNTAVTSGDGNIMRANPDGSDVETVVTGYGKPHKFAISGGMIYWIDFTGTDRIRRANLDGTGVQDLLTIPGGDPLGMAIDPAAGKLYWSMTDTPRVMRMNLDGTGVETFLAGTGYITDIVWTPEPASLLMLGLAAIGLRRR